MSNSLNTNNVLRRSKRLKNRRKRSPNSDLPNCIQTQEPKPRITSTNAPMLIAHEWGHNTDKQSKKLIKELASVVLKRVNIKQHGFKNEEWYIYIDVNKFDEDKIWINRCQDTYEPKSILNGCNVGYFNFFERNKSWKIPFVNQQMVQLFVFDPIVFSEHYASVVDSRNCHRARKQYETKKKQLHKRTVSKRDKDESKTRRKAYLRRAEEIESAAKKTKQKQRRKQSHSGKKRKRNEAQDEIFNEIKHSSRIARPIVMDEAQDINTEVSEIHFFRKHCYYDRQRHKNMTLIVDDDYDDNIAAASKKKRKIMSMNDNNYDSNDWWNMKCVSKFKKQQHYDPGICPPKSALLRNNVSIFDTMYNNHNGAESECKYKLTCYPAPAVYNSFKKCPKSAPFPYIVCQSMSMLSDSMYLKRSLAYLWDNEYHVRFMKKLKEDNHKETQKADDSVCYNYYLDEPQIVSASDYDNNSSIITDNHTSSVTSHYQSSFFRNIETDTDSDKHSLHAIVAGSTVNKTYKLQHLLSINGKCDRALYEWCTASMKHNDELDLFESDQDTELEKEQDDEHILKIIAQNTQHKAWIISEMHLGDKDNRDSPRTYLKMDHVDALNFMHHTNDALDGTKMAYLNISACGARYEWRHNFGLCSWYQVIYGENNIKIWDVEASKMIEECKHNMELSKAQKDYYIASIQPTWEIFLRPEVVLYLPAGCEYLMTTTSNTAVMITGSFIPHSHIRIGYEMAQMARYHLLGAEDDHKANVDWDQIIIRQTANVFNVNDTQLFCANADNTSTHNKNEDKYISIPKRLAYLVQYTKQHNWNMKYESQHDNNHNQENDDQDTDVESLTFD